MIYMDNASTTPLCDAVKERIKKSMGLDSFANPSNSYGIASNEYNKIRCAKIDTMIHFNGKLSKYDVYYTSGATESNNWALRSFAETFGKKGVIITDTIEHPSVYNTALDLKNKNKCTVVFVESTPYGIVDKNKLVREIKKRAPHRPTLVSLMAVNNQLGTIQPIKEVGLVCKEYGAYFHVDATQAIGRVKIDLENDNIDMLSFSAHKFGGMKGIGALICRKDLNITPLLTGGKQNHGKRAGTENVLGILTTKDALENALKDFYEKHVKLQEMEDYIVHNLRSDAFYVNGSKIYGEKVPGFLSLSFRGISGYELSLMLEANKIYTSTTSACETGVEKINRVLAACGYDEDRIKGTIRITLSADNTMEECEELVKKINELLDGLATGEILGLLGLTNKE